MRPLRLPLAVLAITALTSTGAYAASCGNTGAGFGPWLERFKNALTTQQQRNPFTSPH